MLSVFSTLTWMEKSFSRIAFTVSTREAADRPKQFQIKFEPVEKVNPESTRVNKKPIGIAKGPYSGKPNPHAWMSASNAIIYVENIRKALVRYDPANKVFYNENAKTYSQEVLLAVEPYRKIIGSLPENKKWLVTSEGAFSYLARDFDLKELYLWPMNADGQGTPQQVRRLIDKVKANNIQAIFSESTVSPKPAQQVARETGAVYAGVLYVDSLSSETGPVPSYIDLLNVTLSTIVRGLEN